MSAFITFGNSNSVPGESTDSAHGQWVIIQTMSAPIHRSIPEGAKDMQRMRGETTMGDVHIIRELDKSSVYIQQNCADGTLFDKVTIDFSVQLEGKNQTYLRYILEKVIISSYTINAHHSGQPLPSEQITLSYTKAEWNYTKYEPTGKKGDKAKTEPHRGGFDVAAQKPVK